MALFDLAEPADAVRTESQLARPRCLWLTLFDPEPRHSGELLYSGGLIDAAASAGLQLDVLATARHRQAAGEECGNVRWWLIHHKPRPAWRSVVSPLPYLAERGRDLAKVEALRGLLALQRWDGIVFDGVSNGWALPIVQAHCHGRSDRPRILYVSHNHETSLRRRIAAIESNPLRRRLRELEAYKVARLESDLVDSADRVTAITPDDRLLYARRHPGKRIEVLTPGYGGRVRCLRTLTTGLPRRVVVVGSYAWIAKRRNLEEFLVHADPILAQAKVELCVVGDAEEAVLAQWRQRFPATRFTGAVGDVTPYMDEARLAVVPERHGGGFKLKMLDYVFNRVPILALQDSFAGVPVQAGHSVLLFPDHAALARGMVAALDDVDRLNRLQESAFAACRDQFHWRCRGEALRAAILDA